MTSPRRQPNAAAYDAAASDSAGSDSAGSDAAASSPDAVTVSARPELWMRVITFAAVITTGVLGGIIGGSFAKLVCMGDCDRWIALGIFLGSSIAAIGAAVIVRIVLRGSGDW